MWVRNAEPNRPEFALAVGAKGIPPNGPNFAPPPEDHLLRRLGRSARRLRRPRRPRRARYLPAARRGRDFLRVARVFEVIASIAMATVLLSVFMGLPALLALGG